jgi:hypothetical protein
MDLDVMEPRYQTLLEKAILISACVPIVVGGLFLLLA